MFGFQSRNRAANGDTSAVVLALGTDLENYTAEIGHCEQLCDTGIASWQDKHCQNSFAILVPLADNLVRALESQAHVAIVFKLWSIKK